MEIERKRLKGLNSDVVFMTNKALGTRYQQGRFKEWENGKRRPTVKTHNFIPKSCTHYTQQTRKLLIKQ